FWQSNVETRFIASKRLTRSQDAINRRLYREFTRQLFVHRLLFPTCVYIVAFLRGASAVLGSPQVKRLAWARGDQ
ncbi:MAG: hypothetical protein RMX65_000575, partial [Nostoc sp. DedQUE01]